MNAGPPRSARDRLRPAIRAGLAMAAAAALAGLGFLWHDVVRDRVLPKRWSEVAGGVVYRSGQLTAPLVGRTLERHDIRCVIDLTDPQTLHRDRDAERAACERLGIRRVELPLEGDGQGDLDSYVNAIREMERAVRERQPTLVHCQSGAQRVGGVVAAYRLLVERRPAAEAQLEMTKHGWRPGRDRVLIEFLNASMPELARRLAAEGVVAQVPDPLPVLDPDFGK